MVEPEKYSSAVAKRPIQSPSSPLGWWTAECCSHCLPAVLRSMRSTEWAGLMLSEQKFPNGGTTVEAKHVELVRALLSCTQTVNSAVQLTFLFDSSVQHCFHLPVQFCIKAPFQNMLCFCAGWAAEGQEKGMWRTLSLERSHRPLTALCLDKVLFSRVCSCATKCIKCSISECEQPRLSGTEMGPPPVN